MKKTRRTYLEFIASGFSKPAKDLTCDQCGKTDKTVELVIDPYVQDIEGREIEVQLCADCYNLACDEI